MHPACGRGVTSWVAGLPGDPEHPPSRGAHLTAAPAARKVVAITKVDGGPGYIQTRAKWRRSAGYVVHTGISLDTQVCARPGHPTEIVLTVVVEGR